MFYGRTNTTRPETSLILYPRACVTIQFFLWPRIWESGMLTYNGQLMLIYRFLADKVVGDNEKQEEGAMHVMASYQIGLGFFNLPLGIATPLREAAGSC